MIFHDYYDIICFVITIFSISLQFYVTFLIIKVSPKSMAQYRWFIALYTGWDGMFAFFVGIILQPRLYFPSTGFVLQGIGKNAYFLLTDWFGPEIGESVAKISMASVVWAAVNIIQCQDYALIYRYTVIASNQIYHDILMRPKVIAATITFGFVLCFSFAVPSYFAILDFKDISKQKRIYIAMDDSHLYDGVPEDAVWIFFDQWGSATIYFVTLILIGFIVSEVLSISLGFLILKTLKKNSANFSAKTYSLHRQLTILLILQLSTPIIFVIFPITACAMAIIFDLRFRKPSDDIGFIFISLYSSCNSLLTICFVSPYRKFSWNHSFGLITKRLSSLKNDVTSAIIIPQSSTSFTINSQNMRNFN